MNPLRLVDGDFPTTLFVIVMVALAACLVVVRTGRSRPEKPRGGGGYHPADLRPATPLRPTAAGSEPTPQDPEDVWLRGLSATLVEQHGLIHSTWTMLPTDLDAAWQRHLDRCLAEYRVQSAELWHQRVLLGQGLPWLAEAPDDREVDLGPLIAVDRLFVLRLGTAAGYIDESDARRASLEFVAPLRERFTDWFGFGDALILAGTDVDPAGTARLRSTIRALLAPGGPWARPGWPPLDSAPI